LTSITINDQKFRPSFLIVFVDVEVLDLYRQIDFQSMTENPGEQGQAATGFSQPLTE